MPDTQALAVLAEATQPDATLSNVKKVESRGASVIDVPDLTLLEPLLANRGMQLFAYDFAKEAGEPTNHGVWGTPQPNRLKTVHI